MNTEKSLCFSFVCHPGELELKTLLLGASLRLNNPHWGEADVELVAALPDESLWGSTGTETRKLFDELNIRPETVPSCFGREYPIGNKLSALGVNTQAATTVFLDSDILCLERIDEAVLQTSAIKAKPADFDSFSRKEDQWETIYQSFSLPVPELDMVTTVSNEKTRPYYNAGVLAVANAPEFSACWIETARRIDENSAITNKRPWLDQIAFPVAAKRLGRTVTELNENYNYPAHVRILDAEKPPVLCHYHRPAVIAEEKLLAATVGELVDRHPLLGEKMAAEPGWQDVLLRLKHSRKPGTVTQVSGAHLPAGRNFLITGIPRSGTSLLTRLLNSMDNTVVLNEPSEISTLLSDEERMSLNLPLFYRRLRKDVIIGKGVMNKLDVNGQPVEDTFRQQDARKPWQPEVTTEDFWLGTKNPLAYLGRLSLLCRHYPSIPVIAMIRHPLATIGSWKNSFPHLQAADLDRMPFTHDSDPFIDEFQRTSLAAIRSGEEPIRRQARLWAYLAELVWRDRHRIRVLKYEDLVSSPLHSLTEVTSLLGMKEPDERLVVGIRQESVKPDISDDDKDVILEICKDMMTKWGYR